MACWLLMCVNGNSFLVLTYTNAACLLPWMVHKSNLQYFSKVKVKENIYSQVCTVLVQNIYLLLVVLYNINWRMPFIW